MATKLATDGDHDIFGKRYLSADNENDPPNKTDFEKVKKRLKLDDHHDSSDRSKNNNNNNNNANIPMVQQQTANLGNVPFMQCHLSILKSLYMNTCGTKIIVAAITSPSLSVANQDTTDGNDVSTYNDFKNSSVEGLLEEGQVDQDVWDLVDDFLNKRYLLQTNQTQTLRLRIIQQESQRVLERLSTNHHDVSTNPLLFGDVPSSMMSPATMRHVASAKYSTLANSNRPHTNTHGFGTSNIGGPPPSLSAASASSPPHHHHQQSHNPLSMMMMYSPGARPGLPVHATSTTALPSSTPSPSPSPSWALITNFLKKKADTSRCKTKVLGNRFRPLERAVQKRLKRLASLRLSLETKQRQLAQEKAMDLLGTNDGRTIGPTTSGPNQKIGKSEQAVNSNYTSDEEKELLVIVDTKIQLWKMLSQSFEEVKLLREYTK